MTRPNLDPVQETRLFGLHQKISAAETLHIRNQELHDSIWEGPLDFS